MKEIELKYGEARKRARLNWARSEHGKELSKNYMKEYRGRPQEWAKANGYRDNDLLNATNTERITKDAKK